LSYWSTVPSTALVFGALLLNGYGLGLFQVVYTDVVVASLPQAARGVAGSLTMVTRTIGVVTAASALTAALAMFESQHLSSASDAREAYAFAFSQLFLLLSLLPALVFTVACWRARLFRQPA